MKKTILLALAVSGLLFHSCGDSKAVQPTEPAETKTDTQEFHYTVDQFADLRVLRYEIPGWEKLTLKEQTLVYYLVQAGLEGRDIMWDQNYRHNLTIRKALEQVYRNYDGDKDNDNWKQFETYLKRIWFSNGIHHHYSADKIRPEFSADYLKELMAATDTELEGEAFDVIFNDKDAKKINLGRNVDNVLLSAVNFYAPDITNKDVENYYAGKTSPDPERPLSFGLNSRLVKENGVVMEQVYKSGGLYGDAIDKIIGWLEKAQGVAENEKQAEALGLLINYYRTGDLQAWDDYNVAWTAATEGNIDYINGFVEVYNDPLGYKGSYETIVQIKDFEMSERMAVLSENAQWFEDNSPLMDEHKRERVVGVSYKVVNVAGEAGDASPTTPIGVNLPNADWIRAEVGSKSVSLGNIIDAYNRAGSSGRLREFSQSDEVYERAKEYGELADKLHTALHEVIGHASGRLNPGVGEPKETLRNYASTLEEGRADLLGLYYLYTPKLEELGLVDNWKEVGMAAYDNYIRNGQMTQLIRLNLGDDIEQAHMRNRQWVSGWVYDKGKEENVIEKKKIDGKTFFVINDYEKLHNLFGQLLRETQRIKSEGDYAAAQELVETYGVKVDQDIHREVLERNKQFEAAPYSGFVNPVILPKTNASGEIEGFTLEQPGSFEEQMLDYSERYGNL